MELYKDIQHTMDHGKQLMQKLSQGWNTGLFEDIDFLLKRNWFIDEQDIEDLLWSADDETYLKIEANREAYPMRIRMHLAPEDFFIQTNIKIVENF
jgi:hypothetical protein